MVFLTNNTQWAASTICELYKAWTGLLTHLLLHYLKFLSGWNKAFSRLVGIVRSAVWMDLDIAETLRLYGMASPPHRPRPHYIQQCLAGF